MKKKLIIFLGVLIGIYIVFVVGMKLYYGGPSNELLNQLKGEIYYLKRVNGELALFSANADTTNEKLLYSHDGKGETNSGTNDNIISLEVDKETGIVTFVAMYDGLWTEYEYNQGKVTRLFRADNEKIVSLPCDNITVGNTHVSIDDSGSIYLTRNNEKRILKEFKGSYDQNYSTYLLLGISPDEKYLIYADHRNSLGIHFLESLIPGGINMTYVIDLETKEESTFIDATDFVWIQ